MCFRRVSVLLPLIMLTLIFLQDVYWFVHCDKHGRHTATQMLGWQCQYMQFVRVRKTQEWEKKFGSQSSAAPCRFCSAPYRVSLDFRTLFGLFWDSGAHSLGTFGALPRGTLFGLFRGSGPEMPGRPCVWGGRGRSQTLSILQHFSSAGFLLCETFCRTFLQNPKGSAEFWGGGGADLSFEDRLLSSERRVRRSRRRKSRSVPEGNFPCRKMPNIWQG